MAVAASQPMDKTSHQQQRKRGPIQVQEGRGEGKKEQARDATSTTVARRREGGDQRA